MRNVQYPNLKRYTALIVKINIRGISTYSGYIQRDKKLPKGVRKEKLL